MKFPTLFLMLCLCVNSLLGQGEPPGTKEAYEQTYTWRIRQTELYGVYIPYDLADAFVKLNQLSDAKDRQKFAALTEQESTTLPFFGLGRWMSLNWGFYEGSRLTVYLNSLGVNHPDDMTRFMLLMYHRHLNKRPLNPKPYIDELTEARQKAHTERLLQGRTLYQAPRDTTGGG